MQTAKKSGIQGDIFSLYRNLLRVGKTKGDIAVQNHIRLKFREDAMSVRRIDFKKIEQLLRQGNKKLKVLKLPGTKLVGAFGGNTASPSSQTRAFSTSIMKGKWDTTTRPRAHIISLGCGRNWVDSEVMLGDFMKAGYELETEDPLNASLIVVNTCGFLKSARDEGNGEIQRVIDAKTDRAARGLETSIVVTGCMVNLDKEAVLERHPDIDHLIGAAGIGKVLQVIESKERMYSIPSSLSSEQRSHLEQDLLLTSLATGEAPARMLATPPHLAYLKIAEGCRKRCTFCIIPIIKGPLRSKSIPQVVREFKSLVNGGVREVSLIAQDLGDFGKDANQSPISENTEDDSTPVSIAQEERSQVKSQTPELLKLLKEMAGIAKEKDSWVRLLYLYPDEISPELLTLMEDGSILPYLDMPMQHVATSVLKRMGRKVKYDREALEQTIELIQSTPTSETACGVSLSPWRDTDSGLGGVSIRTTLMVGFPGETESDFQELLEFLNGPHGQCLTHIGVFAFSSEEQAIASRFGNQVSEAVKQRRKRQVEAVHNRNLRSRQQSLVDQGRLIVVLIDHIAPSKDEDGRTYVVGRHTGQALAVDGVVQVLYEKGVDLPSPGDVVVAKVVAYSGLDLIADFDRSLNTLGSNFLK